MKILTFKKVTVSILFFALPFFCLGCNKKGESQEELKTLRQQNDSLVSLRAREDKERMEQEKIAQEREAMIKIANNIKYDVISQVRDFYKDLSTSATIDILDKSISVNDRYNDDKYFLVNVDFKIEYNALFWDSKNEYTGKFYYNKSGNYYSSEWRQITSKLD